MKRFYLLLASLFALGTAWAADFVPVEGTNYCVMNTRANKYAQSTETNSKMSLVSDVASLTGISFRFEKGSVDATTNKQGYYIYSVGLGGYVNDLTGLTTDKTKATQWYILEFTGEEGKYAISTNPDFTTDETSVAWNDERGEHNFIAKYKPNDVGSKWTFSLVDDVYTTLHQSYVDRYNNCVAKAHATALLCPNPTKLATAGTYVSANPTTLEEKSTLLTNLRTSLAASRILNASANGLYTIKNPTNSAAGYHEDLLCEATGRKGVHKNTTASRSIWRIALSDIDSTCTIQNYLTGDYIQSVGQDQQVTLSSNAVNYRVYFYGGDNGYVALGTGAQYSHLNFSNHNENIWGWETHAGTNPDGGSQLKVEAVTDDMLAAAAEAEKTLALEESAALDGSSVLKEILGVTEQLGNEDVESLNDYISGTLPDVTVYAKAAGNVYRISCAEGNSNAGKSLSFNDEKTMPFMKTADEKDLRQLWQFEPSGNGFLIRNCNLSAVDGQKAYIPEVVSGVNAETEFDNETNAMVYWIEVTDADNKIIKLRFSGSRTDGHNAINIESSGSLSRWANDNAKLAIAKVESVDIDLNAGGDGKSYATAYLPFAVSGVTGAKAYTAEAPAKGQMLLTEASTGVAANTGIVLIGDAAADKATLTIGEGTATESALQGTTVAKTVDANSVLTLGKSGENVGFFTYTGTGLRANSAYLEAGAGAAALVFSFGDTDAIEGIEAATVKAGKMFDLSGRRVSKAGKGIYVVNGKKIIK